MDKKLLSERVVCFSQEVIRICHDLDYMKQQVISRQLMRSGTGIGASYAEAKHAESAEDFVHKIKIAAKEANETRYWFSVISSFYNIKDEAISELEIIQRMLSKSIATAKGKTKAELEKTKSALDKTDADAEKT